LLAVQDGVEGLALHELHDEVELAPLLPRVQDVADVGVFQAGSDARLAQEALDGLGTGEAGPRQDLHRDSSVEHVPGIVNDAHAPAAEFTNDLVFTDPSRP